MKLVFLVISDSPIPVGNVKSLTELFRIVDHLIHGGPGVVALGGRDHELLHLLELVNAEDAARVPPVGAHLLPREKTCTHKGWIFKEQTVDVVTTRQLILQLTFSHKF
jgi:hypothetical protein